MAVNSSEKRNTGANAQILLDTDKTSNSKSLNANFDWQVFLFRVHVIIFMFQIKPLNKILFSNEYSHDDLHNQHVIVKSLSLDVDEQLLFATFQSYGVRYYRFIFVCIIVDLHLVTFMFFARKILISINKTTGKPKGCGLITFKTKEVCVNLFIPHYWLQDDLHIVCLNVYQGAERAVDQLHGKFFGIKSIALKLLTEFKDCNSGVCSLFVSVVKGFSKFKYLISLLSRNTLLYISWWKAYLECP